jgi:hypothetical protein
MEALVFSPVLTDAGGLEEYFLAVAKYSPANPARLIELARPFGLTLLPPGA